MNVLDQAGIMMAQGNTIACERVSGVNDNMEKNHYHDYYEIYFWNPANAARLCRTISTRCSREN